MNAHNAVQDPSRKLKVHTLLSVLTFVIGIAVMTYGVLVEDEPTAIALLLVAVGIGWFVVTRVRMRSQHK